MPIDRRQLLLGGAALAGCPVPAPPTAPPTPAPRREPSPAPPEPGETLDTELFPWGVVVGEVRAASALVRVRLVGQERCTLVLQRWEGRWVEVGRPEIVRQGFTCPHVFSDLEPDTVYAIHALRGPRRSRVTRFRTAPAGRPSRRICFGATSCMGDGDWDMPNLAHVPDHDLDFFLLAGDTVYADGAITREDYEASWSLHLRRPVMSGLFASTSTLMIWDDHEVDNNWTLDPHSPDSVTEDQLRAAMAVMEEAIPQRRGPHGYYRSHRWGDDLEFFLLDCRGERSEGKMISDEQLAWLEERLLGSTARFKIVCSSVHVTDHFQLVSTIQVQDRWQGYPEQRAALIALLAATPGAFVITGDMHFGSVQYLDPSGPGENLIEVAVGPSGSRLLPVEGIVENLLDGQLPPQYLFVLEDWSWSRIELDPATGEVQVQFIGTDGDVLGEHAFRV